MATKKFKLECLACGNTDVYIKHDRQEWDNGDGYVDVEDHFNLVCSQQTCGQTEAIYNYPGRTED